MAGQLLVHSITSGGAKGQCPCKASLNEWEHKLGRLCGHQRVCAPKQSHNTYKTCATAKMTMHTGVVMNVCVQVHSPEGCQQLCACTTTPELCTTCSSSAYCEWATGQACRKAPLTHVKRGGEPRAARPGALPTPSLAYGRWKEGSTDERAPCARGGVQACV